VGLTAVVMTALTIGVLVIMPAEMEAHAREPVMAAGTTTTSPASNDSGSAPADLIAAHEAVSAPAPCTLSRSE
jgi:hypothetical protein